MTTFVFTQALNTINSKANQVRNLYSNSIVGQYIDYEKNNKTRWKKDKISGKLSEISIQTSTYNKIIPIIYGTNKLAGNIIWLGEVNEVVNNNTTTIRIGKGQKIKQNTIEYFYYLSFAIAICKGEISQLNNVWADNKLLNLADYSYRFYSGTEKQKTDSLIEAVEGIGKVSAYKEICYIVFENFPLSEFNNRIPNFIFEVTRKNNIENIATTLGMEQYIKGINMMPNYGEVLTHMELQYKAGEQFVESSVDWIDGIWYDMNYNNNSNIADGLYSTNMLLTTLPNCEYFSQHVAFFANSINIANCTLKPRVTFNFFNTGYPIYTRTDRFAAGVKWDRYNTPLMGKDNDVFRFSSGTISNGSLISLFTKLKENNKKIVFYPDILFDVKGKPDKNLLKGNINDIHNFFTKTDGYNEFILSYATALKDYVDVFLIGSELVNLTSLQNPEDLSFPAVDELINLAKQVKEILGNNVKVSYAANYKEYHNCNNWYNLDKLWACEYIDFVGINAYFPLTNLPQDSINKEIIKQGWFSGEEYDYKIVNGNRVLLDPKYACKNIKYWWENSHTNPNGTKTAWIPKSKKIWFTEYGFNSVDGTTNEPYKKDGLPAYSNGNVDFFAQRTAIEATEEVFLNSEYVENKFLYYWDMRPYPFYPNRTDLWDDCEKWKYNYCINGKTGISNANIIIHQLFKDADLDLDLIENIEVDEFVDGMIINNSMSIRDALYILQKVYFFDCIENNNKIKFISNKSSIRDKQTITDIYLDDLIYINNKYMDVDVIDNNDLPKKVDLIFLDKNNDYDTTSVYAERESVDSNKRDIETLPVVLDEEKARNVAETSLYLSWLEKTIFSFVLPIKFLFLNTSDLVKLYLDDKSYLLKIKTILVENNLIKIQATQFDNEIYNYTKDILLNPNLEIIGLSGNTNMKIIELPAINQSMINKIYLFFVISAELETWDGANIYFSNNGGRTYNTIDSVTQQSLVGRVFNIPKNTRPYYFDYENNLKVFFHPKINTDLLENVNELELYNGANMALYGNEIIQFKNIKLNDDNSYSVSGLLRGLYNTEKEIVKHSIGDSFIILNNNLPFQEFESDKINFYYLYKAVTFKRDLADVDEILYNIKGKNLKPFTPCHFRYKIIDNKLILEWKEKGRGYANWVDYSDYISVENEKRYLLNIYDSDDVLLKSVSLNNEEYVFDLEGVDGLLKVFLCQVGRYGIGEKVEIKIKILI